MPRLAIEVTFTAKLLSLTLQLAALTHDVGKMTDAFQGKLWGACTHASGSKGEFIRHDAMSYRVLRSLGWQFAGWKRLASLSGADMANAVAAPSAARLRDTFEADLSADLSGFRAVLAPSARVRARMPAVGLALEELVCRAAAFLSLTHHRLPGPGRHDDVRALTYELSLTAATYFNPGEAAQFGDCLRFSAGNAFQLDAALGDTLVEVASDLASLVALAPADFDQNSFLRLVLAYGRPILVLSDYLASGLKSGEAVAHGALLANTVRATDPSTPARPGDTLATHIQSVHRHTLEQSRVALNLSVNVLAPLPVLSSPAQRAIDARRSLTGRFAWQAELHDHLKGTGAALPAFVAVTAGTGSGKTIASAQIMRALGSDRWTYCLGLRSLTLQTGKSYQDDLELSAADLAIVIGNRVSKMAFDKESQAGYAGAGSESMTQESEAAMRVEAQPEYWMRLLAADRSASELKEVFGARKLDFIATPVAVCTVDQLIGVTRLTSVTRALDYKRLQSSDLVLDEVDNYSPEELKHITRLCFLVGLARKNLVCLSATLGPVHVESLLGAYRAGIQLNHVLTGMGADLLFTTAANTCSPTSLVLSQSAPVQAALEHNECFNRAARALAETQPTKAIGALLDCTANDHAQLLDEAVRLHHLNAVDVDGVKVSAGFIKLNTVGSARRLAKYLFETGNLPDDLELAVVCYHARYTGLELTLIDRALNQVTNRKRLPVGCEFSEAALSDYIRPILAGVRKKNLVIVAVTTSIIETGRDHDYDWAILEPSAHRSIIQAAGRVRRHRDALLTSRQNVALIAYPERACGKEGYMPRNPVRVFSFPGPLTALAENQFEGTDLPYPQLLERARTELEIVHPLNADVPRDASARGFLPAYPGGAIRNVVALTPARELTNNLAALEQYVLFKSLTEKASLDVLRLHQSSVSARAQLDKGMWLSSWAYADSFRDESAAHPEDQVFLMSAHTLGAGKCVVGDPMTRAGDYSASVTLEPIRLGHPFRSLLLGGAGGTEAIEELLEAEAKELARSGFTNPDLLEFSCFSPERRGLVPAKVFYAPLTGFGLASSC
jgi:CRISPR-associated endonuclease/helicase Cas3